MWCDPIIDTDCIFTFTPHLLYTCLYKLWPLLNKEIDILKDYLSNINKRQSTDEQKSVIKHSYTIHENPLALVIGIYLSLKCTSWNNSHNCCIIACLD